MLLIGYWEIHPTSQKTLEDPFRNLLGAARDNCLDRRMKVTQGLVDDDVNIWETTLIPKSMLLVSK
jgi:hypothetical protein